MFSRAALAGDLRALGVTPGDVLMVHASVRAVGDVQPWEDAFRRDSGLADRAHDSWTDGLFARLVDGHLAAMANRGGRVRRGGVSPVLCPPIDVARPADDGTHRTGGPPVTYCRFIDDPVQIAALNGQRYVVLRPTEAVAHAYRDVRRAFAECVQGHAVLRPAEPHVTVAGFGEGAPVGAVHQVVAEWARTAGPIRLEIERVSVFPAPFRVVIVQIRGTDPLFQAMSTIRRRGRDAGLHDVAAVPPSDWIFHMSVAYCSTLGEAAWAEVAQAVGSIQVAQASEVVAAMEIVAFDDHEEYSGGVIPLSGTTDRESSHVRA